jgi:hypothetical protein
MINAGGFLARLREFPPLRQFGILTALAFASMLADFTRRPLIAIWSAPRRDLRLARARPAAAPAAGGRRRRARWWLKSFGCCLPWAVPPSSPWLAGAAPGAAPRPAVAPASPEPPHPPPGTRRRAIPATRPRSARHGRPRPRGDRRPRRNRGRPHETEGASRLRARRGPRPHDPFFFCRTGEGRTPKLAAVRNGDRAVESHREKGARELDADLTAGS